MNYSDRTILITGGTGSFGQEFVRHALQRSPPRKLIIFSRDEYKQAEMARRFPPDRAGCLRFFIGDIRDRDRLYRAFEGVDIVIHAAALKQVPAMEYNPIEAVKTNVLGAANIIDAAIDRNISRVIALSTDKAANPVNLYGATKLCSDKLFLQANNYSGQHPARFSVVRYGNVVGSRGSVIPLFLGMRDKGVLPVTDERMTRFWITLPQAVEFTATCLETMEGGEIFVPKIPSARTLDLARVIAPRCRVERIGIRPGEKLHELLVTEEDAHTAVELADRYVILARTAYNDRAALEAYCARSGGKLCDEGFSYRSDANTAWVSDADIERMVRDVQDELLSADPRGA